MKALRSVEPRMKLRIQGVAPGGAPPPALGVRLQGLRFDRGRWVDVDIRCIPASAGPEMCAEAAEAARFVRLYGDALSLVPRVHAVVRFEGGTLVVSDPVRGLP